MFGKNVGKKDEKAKGAPALVIITSLITLSLPAILADSPVSDANKICFKDSRVIFSTIGRSTKLAGTEKKEA